MYCHVEMQVSWNDNAFSDDLVMITYSPHYRYFGNRTAITVPLCLRLWHRNAHILARTTWQIMIRQSVSRLVKCYVNTVLIIRPPVIMTIQACGSTEDGLGVATFNRFYISTLMRCPSFLHYECNRRVAVKSFIIRYTVYNWLRTPLCTVDCLRRVAKYYVHECNPAWGLNL